MMSLKRKHRKALFRNLLTSFFEKGEIKTTLAKAKAVQPQAEKLITLARKKNLASHRRILAILTKKRVYRKLIEETLPSFENISSGYTRIVKLGPRLGDKAEMARLELVEVKKPATRKKTKGTKP